MRILFYCAINVDRLEISIVNGLEQGKILVTGGAGFIGSALIWGLNRPGLRNILVCDQLGEDEKWRNLAPLRFDDYISAEKLIELVEADSPSLK
jgi:ADP-L-glycero-D-manno-heptose 6-epimerase